MAYPLDTNNITPKVETSVSYMKVEKDLKSRTIDDDIAIHVIYRNDKIIELKEISELQPSSFSPGYYIYSYDKKPKDTWEEDLLSLLKKENLSTWLNYDGKIDIETSTTANKYPIDADMRQLLIEENEAKASIRLIDDNDIRTPTNSPRMMEADEINDILEADTVIANNILNIADTYYYKNIYNEDAIGTSTNVPKW